MNMYCCPSCGTYQPHETRQCPLINSKPVCTTCCELCEHYNALQYRCGYIREDKTVLLREKAGNLLGEIEAKEKLLNYFFKKNLPEKAEPVSWEIASLKRQRKELLTQINDIITHTN